MGFPSLRSHNWGGNAIMDNPSVLTISCNAGSYLVTGTDALLAVGQLPLILSVNYDWNRHYPRAFHPSLRKPIRIAIPGNSIMSASEGSYTWTGSTANLSLTALNIAFEDEGKTFPRQFAPGPWGHLTTQRSFNRMGPFGLRQLQFPTSGTTYSLSGANANLAKGVVFELTGGSYAVTGTAAALGGTALLTGGSYTWTGTAASLTKSHVVSFDSGVFVWTGTTATLRYSRLTASGATYVISGSSVNIHTGFAQNSNKPNLPTLPTFPIFRNKNR